MIGNPQQARAQMDTLMGLADFIALVVSKPANVKAVLAEIRDDVAAMIATTEEARAMHVQVHAVREGLDDGLAGLAEARAALASESAAFAESVRVQAAGLAQGRAEIAGGRDALVAADHVLREQKAAVEVATTEAAQRNADATKAMSQANALKAEYETKIAALRIITEV